MEHCQKCLVFNSILLPLALVQGKKNLWMVYVLRLTSLIILKMCMIKINGSLLAGSPNPLFCFSQSQKYSMFHSSNRKLETREDPYHWVKQPVSCSLWFGRANANVQCHAREREREKKQEEIAGGTWKQIFRKLKYNWDVYFSVHT